MTSIAKPVERISILPKTTCPHCWREFAPEMIRWISASPELMGDAKLGDDAQVRFLPSRFSVQGNALDSRGGECQELACPRCHLEIPRPLLSLPSFYVSIAGTPSCGKSYLLASMTWQLRKSAAKHFSCMFGDADPSFNKLLNEYEEQQFFNPNQDEIVKLAKTEEYGDLYDSVSIAGQTYTFPQPFLFTIQPGMKHPNQLEGRKYSRVVCLYDNAGESYQAGKDTVTNQVTRHLAVAHAYFYCFDPTQDPRVRNEITRGNTDYQVKDAPVTSRQETLLYELIQRVRKHSNLRETEQTPRPLFVICTKYDAWWRLLGEEHLDFPARRTRKGISSLDGPRIREVSNQVREIMNRFSPELVSAAESFSKTVYFLPASATGRAPERDDATGIIGLRPKDVNPMWCDVPMLMALAGWSGGLIPYKQA